MSRCDDYDEADRDSAMRCAGVTMHEAFDDESFGAPVLRRSLLYVPASNERALDKAVSLDADGFIIDLEDAVAPEAKSEARARVAAHLHRFDCARPLRIVRVNARDTPWWAEDIETICRIAPDAILIPKIADAHDVRAAHDALSACSAPEQIQLWVMVETARALLDLPLIAATAREKGSRLSAFVLGTNDLAKETRARTVRGRAPMAPWLSLAAAAARAYGLAVFDGVFADLSDLEGFRAECEQGRDFGMDGKTIIHPSQIDVCNEVFSPSPEETSEARAIVEAFAAPENRGRGAIRVAGRMVEKLHADEARRTLAMARLVEARRAGRFRAP